MPTTPITPKKKKKKKTRTTTKNKKQKTEQNKTKVLACKRRRGVVQSLTATIPLPSIFVPNWRDRILVGQRIKH